MGDDEYLSLSRPSANWSCVNCLFPGSTWEIDDLTYSGSQTITGTNLNMPKLRRGFKVAHLNVNRLYNKLDSVRNLLSSMQIDILSLSETWFSSDILENEVVIDGYSAVRKDREKTARKSQGGGIIVYIRNGINYTVRSDLMVNGIESVWIQVNRPKCKPLIVGSFYRAPDDDIDQFLEGLNQSLGSLDSVEIVILGDFNVDFSSSVRRSPMKQSLIPV